MIDFLKNLCGTYYQSNYLSFKLRKFIERTNLRKVIGLQLASTMFIAGIIMPQANIISSAFSAGKDTETTLLTQNTQTTITFRWPLENYQISQYYRFYHPGLDLTTSYGNPVSAISDGTIETANFSNWGYGKHVIIRHDNGYFSLYAHLSQILVKEGDHVSQGTTIGEVGSSGWSTGPHLHLEIRGPEGTINPQDVLPTNKNP